MNRCTVCGATSREGAKFCTSCGARLGEENETSTATSASESARSDSDTSATTSDTAAEPIVTTPGTTQEPEPDHASTSTSSTAGNDHYSSSWPGAESSQDDDNEKEVEEPATETPDSATASTAQEPQTPGDSIVETSWPERSGEAADDDADDPEAVATPAPATETSGTGDADDEDHHGASDWESWAPTPSAPAPKSSGGSFDEHFVKLHALLDEMRLRLERTTNPATLAARNLDPDELADQLERWSRAVPDSHDLLETVKQARRSPKDIDALRQLADHAADLELLVRHYQSITETSDQWATNLRRGREELTIDL